MEAITFRIGVLTLTILPFCLAFHHLHPGSAVSESSFN